MLIRSIMAYIRRLRGGSDTVSEVAREPDEVADAFLLFDRSDPPEPDERQRAVLIVDDEPNVRRALSRILRYEGLRPITLSDGREAVRVCLEESPVLVFLDLSMPSLNGPQVLKALRTHMGERCPPVVLITGTVSSEHLSSLGGAVACIAKPFDVEAIREVTGRYVSDAA